MVDLKKVEVLAKDPEKRAQAVELYQKLTGQSLKGAEMAIKSFLKYGDWSESIEAEPDEDSFNKTLSILEHPLQGAADLAKQGKKVEAAQKYHELTGMNLKDSLAAVESYLNQGDWFAPLKASKPKVQQLETENEASSRTASILEHPLDAVKRSFEEGNEEQALERYQEITGSNLEEAKVAIEYFKKKGSWGNPIKEEKSATPSRPVTPPRKKEAKKEEVVSSESSVEKETQTENAKELKTTETPTPEGSSTKYIVPIIIVLVIVAGLFLSMK